MGFEEQAKSALGSANVAENHETNSTTIRTKINIEKVFNQVIDYINEADEIPRAMQIMDIKFTIILGYMIDISNRAIELKDDRLLELLKGLGCVTDEKRTGNSDSNADGRHDDGDQRASGGDQSQGSGGPPSV